MVSMRKTEMNLLKEKAKVSLAKHGVEADGKGGVKVRLVLDHSGSMDLWYRNGAVQRLTEQVLALAAALDDDGTIETWYFGSEASPMYEVSLNPTPADTAALPEPTPGRGLFGRRQPVQLTASPADPYYVGWVDRTHPAQRWGSTNYPAGMSAPVRFAQQSGDADPALVIFQTDGGPDYRDAADAYLRQVSGEKTFFAFVVFGEETDPSPHSAAAYMKTLDTLSGRVRDNASVFFTGGLSAYAGLADEALYDGVLKEFVGQWLPQVL